MKKIFVLTLGLFLSWQTYAQLAGHYLHLTVEKELKLQGKLTVESNQGDNTIFGFQAGENIQHTEGNSDGRFNTFFGLRAGKDNTTGQQNTFIGHAAGDDNSTGNFNVFLGLLAGRRNTTGSVNTFLGTRAGLSNTTGSNNVFIGDAAGSNNTIGIRNIFNGRFSGFSNTTGSFNVFMGHGSGSSTLNGSSNIFLGDSAGNTNVSGFRNTIIGAFADVSQSGLRNATAIGYNSMVDANNKVVIGNSSITVIGGYANWQNLSDKRYKKQIKAESNHLDFILKLAPVSYQYNTVKLVKEEQAQLARFEKQGTSDSYARTNELAIEKAAALKAARQKDKIRYSGFLAQDVEKAANSVGYQDFSGIVKPEVNGGKYALRYAEFVVPLVGAVQEQQTVIEQQSEELTILKEENMALATRLDQLENALADLLANNPTAQPTTQKATLNGATLGQNRPNPFKGTTQLPYSIPVQSQSARMLINDAAGKTLKTISIQQFGDGVLELNIDGLAKGTYFYSLEIDGQIIKTLPMQLMR